MPKTSLVTYAAAIALIVSARSSGAESLREQLKDVEVGARWIYDDWASAQDRARKEKKPIFALFR